MNIGYLRYRVYRDELDETRVIKSSEDQEKIQGILSIFTTSAEVLWCYNENAISKQVGISTIIVKESIEGLLPTVEIIYSSYHIEIRTQRMLQWM